MLLPFAGFIYGSIFHIQYLSRNPSTSWLVHFVFPVNTLFPLGIVLMCLGFIIFLIGAVQIYVAKFRKTGLVTTGLYKKFRHPQYVALVFFGLGTILTWGRFTTFMAFSVMMALYYHLARSEERKCEQAFGKSYEEYKARTYFLFPGEVWIGNMWNRLPGRGLPRWVTMPLSLILVIGLALFLGFFIQYVKVQRQDVPFITAEIELPSEDSGVPLIPYMEREGGRFVLVQGPMTLAQRRSYAERLLQMVFSSPTLKERLAYLRSPSEDRAVALVGHPGRHPRSLPGESSKVELFIVRVQPISPEVKTMDLLLNPYKRRFVSAFVASVDPTKSDGDPVIECYEHPLPGIIPRWEGMMERIKERVVSLGGDVERGPKKLILVQAPLVRARDKRFAQEIMDRMLRSETVKKMLARYQIGGDVVAVAFPRPGPNWYREHHGLPQIGVFIMLVRKDGDISDSQIFRYGMKHTRELKAAFIVDIDFAIPYPKDPVYQDPFIIGPLRDLEERWDFFLSGL